MIERPERGVLFKIYNQHKQVQVNTLASNGINECYQGSRVYEHCYPIYNRKLKEEKEKDALNVTSHIHGLINMH